MYWQPCFFLSVTTATAAENVEKVKASSNYIVTPSPSIEVGVIDKDVGILTVYDTISQGEINIHEKTVGSGLNLLVADLNWGDSTDSLRLKIYTLVAMYWVPTMIMQMVKLTVGSTCIFKIQKELKRGIGSIRYMGIKLPEQKIIQSKFDHGITQIMHHLCGR